MEIIGKLLGCPQSKDGAKEQSFNLLPRRRGRQGGWERSERGSPPAEVEKIAPISQSASVGDHVFSASASCWDAHKCAVHCCSWEFGSSARGHPQESCSQPAPATVLGDSAERTTLTADRGSRQEDGHGTGTITTAWGVGIRADHGYGASLAGGRKRSPPMQPAAQCSAGVIAQDTDCMTHSPQKSLEIVKDPDR